MSSSPAAAAEPNKFLKSILDANETYASAFAQADPRLLRKLAKGQSPRICWIGCSDSRVSAELSTGVAPGSIFVHRNVANSFNEQDLSAAAALTYAVNVLGVEAIIVCGHTGCGGVRAAMEAAKAEVDAGQPAQPRNQHERIVTEWIKPLKDLALSQITSETQGAKDTSASTSAEDAYDPLSIMSIAHLTDTHVAETVRAVAESSIVQDAWKAGKKLSVHGWVYHVGTAKLRDLDISYDGVDSDSSSGGGGGQLRRAPSLYDVPDENGVTRAPSSFADGERDEHFPPVAEDEESDEEKR